jgi:hypothetical protein
MTTNPAPAADDDDVLYSTAEALEIAAVSKRQLLHWTSAGLIATANGGVTGSGIPWKYTAAEVAIAGRASDLIRSGMDVRPAIALARRWETTGGEFGPDPVIAIDYHFVLVDTALLAEVALVNPLNVPTSALMDEVTARLADIGVTLEAAG